MISITGILGIQNVEAQTVFNWKGGNTNSVLGYGPTSWENPANWTTSTGATASRAPGFLSTTDIVDFAVSSTSFTNMPTLTTSVTIASIEFGAGVSITSQDGSGTTIDGVQLTVNNGSLSSTTLNVTGDISVDANTLHNAGNYHYLLGNGTINCKDINVGSTSTSGKNNNYFLSDVATLNVSSNVVVTATAGLVNGNGFRLESGTMTINGVITILNNGFKVSNVAYFTINTVTQAKGSNKLQTVTNPILILTNANPISALPVPAAGASTPPNGYGSVNFYGDTGGTSTVTYTSASPNVATTAFTGFGSGDGSGGIDTTKANYYNLIINGTGTAQVGSGTGRLKLAGSLTTSSPTTFANQNTYSSIAGNWNNTSVVKGGAGNYSVVGNLNNGSSTTSGGSITLGDGDLGVGGNLTNTIPLIGTTGDITIDGNTSNSSNLTLASGNLTMSGNYTATSTAVFKAGLPGPTGPSVYFNSTDAQVLVDNSSAGTVFNNVTFTNTGAKTITAGSGNFAVSPVGVLTMAGSATLAAGSSTTAYLTFQSGATSTATLAKETSTASATPITGFVNVQRYFAAGPEVTTRNYRSLSSAVYNATVSGTNIYTLSYLNNSTSGVFTAGPGTKNNTTPPSTTTGFTVVNATPTVDLYRGDVAFSNNGFNAGNFKGLTNIAANAGNTVSYYPSAGTPAAQTTTIPVGNGFLVYYCGDNIANVTSTTIKNKQFRVGSVYIDPDDALTTQTGVLNQGPITVKLWYNGGNPSVASYALIGNPYASSIDLDTYSTSPSAGISSSGLSGSSFYVFNYSSKNYGTYVVGLAGENGIGTNNATHVIASGQGFYVRLAASSTFAFNEAAKTLVQPNNVSNSSHAASPSFLLLAAKPQGTAVSALSTSNTPTTNSNSAQLLRVRLAKDSVDTDDIMITFEAASKNSYEANYDIDRMTGAGNIATLASYGSGSNAVLSVNRMHSIDSTTRVKLYVNVTSSATTDTDTLSATGFSSLDNRYDVYLVDHYKKDSLLFSTYGKYLFNINSGDTTSYGSNRFELVFRKKNSLVYRLLSFTATQVKQGVQLNWTTSGEGDSTRFELQRKDGSSLFLTLSDLLSNGQGSYSYIDKSPFTGTNYYRLLQTDSFDAETYSNIISINNNFTTDVSKTLTLYPNPASNQFNVTINTDVPDKVMLKVTNAVGEIVINRETDGDNIQQAVSNLLPGSYVVEVTDSKTKKNIGVTKFIKR